MKNEPETKENMIARLLNENKILNKFIDRKGMREKFEKYKKEMTK